MFGNSFRIPRTLKLRRGLKECLKHVLYYFIINLNSEEDWKFQALLESPLLLSLLNSEEDWKQSLVKTWARKLILKLRRGLKVSLLVVMRKYLPPLNSEEDWKSLYKIAWLDL